MRIIPVIFGENAGVFVERLRQVEQFTDYVQIDVIDCKNRNLRFDKKWPNPFIEEVLSRLVTTVDFELHLTVKKPFYWMERMNHPKLRKVIFPFEAPINSFGFVSDMKKRGLEVSVSIRSDTCVGDVKKLLEVVDELMILTSDPGFGNKFKEYVVEKVYEARRLFPCKKISVDGGISLSNLSLVCNSGADSACVGTDLFCDGNPGDRYRKFVDEARRCLDFKDEVTSGG